MPCLRACADQQGATVTGHLETTFRRHGVPEALFVDNGPPWGEATGESWTRLGVWLLKLGVKVLHSRPYHPQGRGKNERFHRTLAAEVFALERFADLAARFKCWIVVGMPEVDLETGVFYNTAVLIGPDGPAGRYRKTHAYISEPKWAKDGDLGLPVFETPLGRIALTICMRPLTAVFRCSRFRSSIM